MFLKFLKPKQAGGRVNLKRIREWEFPTGWLYPPIFDVNMIIIVVMIPAIGPESAVSFVLAGFVLLSCFCCSCFCSKDFGFRCFCSS